MDGTAAGGAAYSSGKHRRRRRFMRPMVVACVASLLIVPSAFAQSFTTAPCSNEDGSSNHSWSSGARERACESRRTTLPLAGQLQVVGKNGGNHVVGEDRNDVALEAQVIAQALSREDAEQLMHEVRVETAGTIHAEGPKTGN